ncbi:MAG: FHA domain-containing protein [Pirellulaceae bacterium]|nr:FHA domain-containing protein [Planctomycetales bacterium]
MIQAKLKVTKGSSAGKEIPISKAQFVIGRADGCHLRPNSDAISRRHCAVLMRDDGVYAKDLGSRNGTFVNDVQITGKQKLEHGDMLRVGPIGFEVILVGAAEQVSHKESSTPAVSAQGPAAGPSRPSDSRPSDSGMISEWLQDDNMSSSSTSDDRTRHFVLDETSKSVTHDTVEASAETTKIVKKRQKPEKKEPGKLPLNAREQAKDSQEAAAKMLRKMFNRGT